MERSRGTEKYERIAISRIILVVIVVVILVVVSVGAVVALNGNSGKTTTSIQQVTLNGAGSTLVNPLMSSWTYNYTILNPNIRVNYASIGSGAGITQLEARVVDFGASDAPLNLAQYTAFTAGNSSHTGVLQIPEVAGAVVPAYNLPGIPTGLNFTGTVLANIYLGKITMWNDLAIQQLNPSVSLPNASIFVVHRSDGSGTTFVWTDYLSQASQLWNNTVGENTAVSWPLGFGAKGSEGVSGVIQGNQYSIGYMESAYATIDKLTFGKVQNAAGNFVLASGTTAAAAVAAAASTSLPQGFESWINVSIVNRVYHNSTAANAYPITTFTYIMVYTHQADSVKGTALANFLWWLVNDAQTGVSTLGYVPLPQSVVSIDDATIKLMTYNGQQLLTSS